MEKVFKILDITIGSLSFLILIAFISEYGFDLREQAEGIIYLFSNVLIIIFILYHITALLLSKNKVEEIKKMKFPYAFSLLLLLQFVLIACGVYKNIFSSGSNEIYYHTITQVFIFFLFVLKLSKANVTYLLNKKLKPVQLFILSFLILIIIGTLLLKMPASTVNKGNISILDALFTSTSAVCVTGLIVKDTANDFTTFGKIIILILIQLGGLGIMTSTAFLTMLFFSRISVTERFMLSEIYTHESLPDIPNILKAIFFSTISIELFCSAVLFISWHKDLPSYKTAIFHSVFHSVSAFCNAGFSTFSDSLMKYSNNIPVIITISFLIIIGGLGFLTLFNLFSAVKPKNKKIISTHTKIVLTVSLTLITTGTLLIFLLEYNNSFINLTLKEKILSSFFQSVTARTAGFNTVNIGSLTTPILLLISFLMLIGGSPGSTAGGIKTTTFGILIASVSNTIQNKDCIEIFKRKIDNRIVFKAFSLAVLSLSYVSVIFMLMLIMENKSPVKVFFEVISAFGTVGLSTGITSMLSSAGKILIILTMFIGRLGPITLALSISRQNKKNLLNYPVDSNIMIG
ncbi:MAG: hypothetical protein JXB50_15680 [Spirochaetes bacterium]|nr:hypothetical protein [Spirochaetota bacterium]